MKEETLSCSKCGKEKSRDEFYRLPAAKTGRHSHCKTCHGKKTRKAKKEDPYRFF